MKQFTYCLLILIFSFTSCAQKGEEDMVTDDARFYDTVPYVPASAEKMQWFRDAKFGMFIHWGVYAVPAGYWSEDNTFESRFDGDDSDLYSPANYSERLLHKTQMKRSEYVKIADLFDWSDFNARDYIDLCFASGQRYIVITTKHHDGFAIWRSKVNDWNIGDATPYGRESGRDPLKELADACQATKTDGSPWEIKMCFYHSHCVDWFEEGAAALDYAYMEDPTVEEFQGYLDRKVKPQLRELLTEYGDIGMIWFDVPRIITKEQAIELRELVNELSPNTIVNGRLGQDQGNYAQAGDNGSVGVAVDFPWETGSSINESFGYHAGDHEHKRPEWIINKLINVSAHGGNYLLNIGPKSDGSISDEDRQTLSNVGAWTSVNGEAIFGTSPTPYMGDKVVQHDWGNCTQRNNKLYLLVTNWPEDNVIDIPLLQNKVKKIYALVDEDRIPLPYSRETDGNGNDVINLTVKEDQKQFAATVFVVECKGEKIELAPFKHGFDASKQQIVLSVANAHLHAANVKDYKLFYDRDERAYTEWRYSKGRAPTIAWTYEVPSAGEYKVEVEYGAIPLNDGVPLDVLVDGEQKLSFRVESAGGLNSYKIREVGTVVLEEGRQDIALDVVKSNDVNSRLVMQPRGVCLTKL